jgi:hypothetical protein
VPVSGLADAVALSAGGFHACAVRATGEVVCWGYNLYGQLGNGSTSSSSTPVSVPGLVDAVAVAAGEHHSCAVRKTGEVVCWGYGGGGQLGNGDMSDSSTPVPVSDLGDAAAVTAGQFHTCALRKTGEVVCWGADFYGQLGNGATADSPMPVAVSGLGDAKAVGAGFGHTCAVRTPGEVVCWGRGRFGQLGDGGTSDSSTPVGGTGLTNATALAAGFAHTCAALATGQVVCWGQGGLGQIANCGTSNSTTPVPVFEADPSRCPASQHDESGVCVNNIQHFSTNAGTSSQYWCSSSGSWHADWDLRISIPCSNNSCAYRWFFPLDVQLTPSSYGGSWSLEPGPADACDFSGPGPTTIDLNGTLHLLPQRFPGCSCAPPFQCYFRDCYRTEVVYTLGPYFRRVEIETCAGL